MFFPFNIPFPEPISPAAVNSKMLLSISEKKFLQRKQIDKEKGKNAGRRLANAIFFPIPTSDDSNLFWVVFYMLETSDGVCHTQSLLSRHHSIITFIDLKIRSASKSRQIHSLEHCCSMWLLLVVWYRIIAHIEVHEHIPYRSVRCPIDNSWFTIRMTAPHTYTDKPMIVRYYQWSKVVVYALSAVLFTRLQFVHGFS